MSILDTEDIDVLGSIIDPGSVTCRYTTDFIGKVIDIPYEALKSNDKIVRSIVKFRGVRDMMIQYNRTVVLGSSKMWTKNLGWDLLYTMQEEFKFEIYSPTAESYTTLNGFYVDIFSYFIGECSDFFHFEANFI